MIRKPRVLIIDDDPGIRRTLEKTLGSRGVVMTADDGAQGLAMARAHAPDVIVLDVLMPGLDGYAVCRRLQDDPFLSHIPVLMLTALCASRQQCDGLERGADDYLPKPFDVAELRARIDRLIVRSADFTHTTARRV